MDQGHACTKKLQSLLNLTLKLLKFKKIVVMSKACYYVTEYFANVLKLLLYDTQIELQYYCEQILYLIEFCIVSIKFLSAFFSRIAFELVEVLQTYNMDS